jgi:outer membrane lipoprotein-sorting protein
MPETNELHAAYPDLLADADAGSTALIGDLDALYSTAEPKPAFVALLRRQIAHRPAHVVFPPSEPEAHPIRRPIVRRWQPLAGLATVAILILSILAVSAPWDRATQAVSAQTILDRARDASSDAPAASIGSYHVTATGTEPKGDGANQRPVTMHGQLWYAGKDRWRTEEIVSDASGAVIETGGTIVNGTQAWRYSTQDGQTRVMTRTGQTNARDPWDGMSNIHSLAELLATASREGCGTAQQQGETTIAGRVAYIVAVTPNPQGCSGKFEQAPRGRMVLSVDKQTFLPLKLEQYRADGTLQASLEATGIEYNVAIPDNTFTYTPPPGAIVTDQLSGADGTQEPKRP